MESSPDPTAIEDLLTECLAAAPEERTARMDDLCARHPGLAPELRRLLAALGRTLEGLEEPRPSDLGPAPERLGEYRLLRRLGGGGMGVVYEARDEALGRTVAVKLIRPELLYFERSRERFRREVEAVGALQHPGVVPVYTVGEREGVPYFVMERFEGRTLARALAEVSRRSPESLTAADLAPDLAGTWIDACLATAQQIAEALEHAHGRGILHRDVKPSNVALADDGRARLFDFGLSGSADDSPAGEDGRVTHTGARMGTLPYASPEQLRDPRHVDARSDVYALGVTLYELLTLQLPFPETSPTEIERRILAGRPDPIRARNRAVATDVETVCLVAMDVDPERRYPTAAALARDLANLRAHRPIEARPPGPTLRARRWVQRHPVLATAGALGALLIGGVPSALWWQSRGHARELGRAYDETAEALGRERDAHADASREREAARAAADRAERSLAFLTDVLHRASPHEHSGPLPDVVDVVLLGADHVTTALADHPGARGRVQQALGVLLIEFDELRRAREVLERAIASLGEADDPALDDDVIAARYALADALSGLGEFQRAEEMLRDGIAATRASGNRLGLRLGLNRLATALVGQRRYAEYDEVCAELDDLVVDEPDALGVHLLNRGRSLAERGRHDEARQLLDRALAVLEAEHEPPHPRLCQAWMTLGHAAASRGDFADAEQHFLAASAGARELYGEHNEIVPVSERRLAEIAWRRGRIAEAEKRGREAARLYAAVQGDASPVTADANALLGNILLAAGKPDEAAALLAGAIAIEGEHRLQPAVVRAEWLVSLGRAEALRGNGAAGAAAFTEALELLPPGARADAAREELERLHVE